MLGGGRIYMSFQKGKISFDIILFMFWAWLIAENITNSQVKLIPIIGAVIIFITFILDLISYSVSDD